MNFLDIHNIAFKVLSYPLSYVELIATIFGLVSVYLAAKSNIWTWGTGIINEVCSFILFYQIQLYADMFLQVFFLMVTMYGWYSWKQQSEDDNVFVLKINTRIILISIIILGTICLGQFLSQIHIYFPIYFSIPSDVPYIDALITVMSIIATFLMAKKKIETWLLWLLVDVICAGLFYYKGIYFLSIVHLIFLILVIQGGLSWRKKLEKMKEKY